jgi:hypothetical protein
MPDVVVTYECAIAATWRNGGVFNETLFEEVERRLITQSLEGAVSPITRLGPELRIR